MEEQPPATAVSVATGALGPLLEKLTALLGDEQHRSRLGAGTRRDIESIRSMLASLHSLLFRIWEREDLGEECKEWMTDARALSYDMEDDMDDCMLGLERGDVDISHGELNKLLRNLKMSIEAVSRRCHEEWKTAAISISMFVKRIKLFPEDPRAGFLHKDASELVGMDRPFSELQHLLQSYEMVCIHGFAGTGKTTLADLVYQEIGSEFDCRAFVSLSKSPDMVVVMGAILTQVAGAPLPPYPMKTEPPTEELIDDICISLSGKRYLVVVDDIWLWESWTIIKRALPRGNGLSRIIATTRVDAIADKCCHTMEGAAMLVQRGIDDSDAATLSQRILHEKNESLGRDHYIYDSIAYMCGGMTLAVRCLSSAAVASIDDTRLTDEYVNRLFIGKRHKLWHMLLDGLLCNNPKLRPMVESLRLGYEDLPIHVKTCLLYCSIFPTNYKIERNGLVRKWIAQGFFPKGSDQEKEAAAEACLDELVSSGLLQQEKLRWPSTSYITVHPMMRAFLLWKSKEANFATCLELPPYEIPPSYSSAPMLFVGFGTRLNTISEVDGSRARCLVVSASAYFGWYLFHWQDWKRVRVLSVEGSQGLPIPDGELMAICSHMTRLRYLGLKGTHIRALPQQLGSLLETLDVSKTAIGEVPKEIGKLHHMKILDVSNTRVRELPRDIGKLQHLKILDVSKTAIGEVPKEIGKLHHMKILDVSNTRVRELPRDIGKLQHLKILDLSNSRVQELPWLCFSSSVSVLIGGKPVKFSDGVLAVMQAWNNHTISTSVLQPGKDLSLMLCDYLCQPLPVAGLKVVGSRNMMGIPVWVKQHLANESSLGIRLWKLNQHDLDFLRNQMPYLKLLTLRLEVLPRTPVVITGQGFSMLQSFCLDCRLPMVTFEEGAMPKLVHLEFKFYTSRPLTSQDPVGIRHLLSLKRVVFQGSPRYKSDAPGISLVINKVRKEAKEHRNKITISINGEDEVVFQEKEEATTTTSASDIVSEENIVTSGGAAGGSSGASMTDTSLHFPYNNGTGDEKGSIVPVKSYYPFGITE